MATSNFFKGGNSALLDPVEQGAENPSSTTNYGEGDLFWNTTVESFYKISSGSWVLATFSGSSPALNSISDVNTAGVTDGQGIAFDASTSTWKPVTFGTGSSSALNGLSDVNVTGASNSDILYYDNSTSVWRRQPFSTQEAYSSLSDLTTALSSTYAALSHTHSASAITDFRSAVFADVDQVAGGSGFVNASGAVTVNLNNGRSFHYTMTGNITGLTFSNIPSVNTHATSWTVVLRIDATGGYTLSGTPTVTWVDGSAFSKFDLTANAENVATFWRIGATTYGALVTNGTIDLDPFVMSFSGDGTQLVVVSQAETLDLSSVTHVEIDGTAGTGTLSYKKNNAAASGSTAFSASDVLAVTLSGSSAASTVSIPRSL